LRSPSSLENNLSRLAPRSIPLPSLLSALKTQRVAMRIFHSAFRAEYMLPPGQRADFVGCAGTTQCLWQHGRDGEHTGLFFFQSLTGGQEVIPNKQAMFAT
jgi:hypothetical protein